MLFELNQHGRGELLAECRRLLRLALPILIAQVAQVGVGVVDTVMAGHASANDRPAWLWVRMYLLRCILLFWE